ncbi:MAG: hypothetical protein KatS3mg115_1992 [Candidatus Poribacteria bacterium]|nr:MAG: hypothetical protein KatS3mg115_1992 [Candidatus Poribacteria bacterium]
MRRVPQGQRELIPVAGAIVALGLIFLGWILRLGMGPGRWAPWAVALLGLLMGMATVLGYRQEWKRLLRSRQAGFGAVTALSVVLVLGIFGVVNVLAARHLDVQYDLTQEKFFSLSEQTERVLAALNEPVHVIGFFTSDPSDVRHHDRMRAEQLLTLYRRTSRGRITFELVDPYLKPQLAQQYGVQYENLVVFQAGERRETTTNVSETDFTAALVRLTRAEPMVVYFLVGHDERLISDYSDPGYREAADALERLNYVVQELALREQNPVRVPEDAAAVVVAGPRLPFDASELAALEAYLRRGGRLLLLLDPPTDAQENLIRWLRRWGVQVGNDVVIDLLGYVQEPTIPVGQFLPHQITESFLRLRRSVPFRFTCSVEPVESVPKGLRVERLVQTNESQVAAWAETNLNAPPRLDPADRPGPIAFGVAVLQESDPGARLVVLGDSDFASNAFYRFGGGDFFVNIVNWLTLQEELIAIPPKDPSERVLRPVASRGEALTVIGVTMFFMPLVFTLIGLAVWWRRR